jgi:hypothetical protein
MTEAAEVQVGGRASGRLRTSRYAKVLPQAQRKPLPAEVDLEVMKYSTFQLGMNSFAVLTQRS